MSWVPTTDFEEELVSLQPDHNFIFGALSEPEPEFFYPRPQTHLDFAAKQKKNRQQISKDNSSNQKLSVIAEVQRITGSKPLGELPTVDDWNSSDKVVEETVAMMRHFGLGPSVEQPLDEKRTLPTLPVDECIYVNQQGKRRMPIIFDDNFFKWDVPDYSIPAPCGNYACNKTGDSRTVDTINDSSVYSTTTSQSFSTADDEEPGKVAGKCGRYARIALVDYEKLPNTACGSRINLLSESKVGETEPESERDDQTEHVGDDKDCNYETPNSGDIIYTQSWYRSGYKANSKQDRVSTSPDGHMNGCVNSSSPCSSSSSTYYPPYPQQQRFYTTKELYQLKRQNKC